MQHSIATLDWLVIATYLLGLIAFAYWLSRRQENRDDYYVGGRSVGAWPVALSIMATQCSTNSILGAPAFVAFAAGGGLVWLQYELALPLAMIALMLWVLPLFRQLKLISVYEYLERRFDLRTRLLLSGLFLFVRAFATAVTVYSIALVVDLITGIGFFGSVVLIGVFTVIYDVLGGIRGVIYSDVIQMTVLVCVLLLLFGILVFESGGFFAMLDAFDPARREALDFAHHGLGDGQTFAFWPMLFGGLFLYIAYYGCDQSQVQRELSTKNIDETNKALMINGFFRFPLVALYCLIGVGIAVYAQNNPQFIAALPNNGDSPEYNLAVPLYMITTLPVGLVGIALVALFAAAMSSLDSVLNSLSATTMEDYVRRFSKTEFSPKKELFLSRGLTATWGVLTLAMAFFVGDIATTVLEAINKIGSLANGPILAVFALGIFRKDISGIHVCIGLVLGMVSNAALWLYAPNVSWLWWNVSGFLVCCAVAQTLCSFKLGMVDRSHATPIKSARHALIHVAKTNWYERCIWLFVWFLVLMAVLAELGESPAI